MVSKKKRKPSRKEKGKTLITPHSGKEPNLKRGGGNELNFLQKWDRREGRRQTLAEAIVREEEVTFNPAGYCI